MSKKVLPQEITTESLLKELEKNNVINEEEIIHDNILEFLSFYNIKSGDNIVKRTVLYKMFKAWSKGPNYGSKYFGTKINQLFKSHDNDVYINIEAIDLTKKAKDVFFKSDTTKRTKIKSFKKQIDSFILNFGIVKGKYSVDSLTLYYIYEEWALKNRKKVLSILDFSFYLNFYLDSYKEYAGKYTNYYIDKDNLKVDGVTLEKAKAWSEAQNKKPANKTKVNEKAFSKKKEENKS